MFFSNCSITEMQAIPPEIVLKIVSHLKSVRTITHDIVFDGYWMGYPAHRFIECVTYDDSDVTAAKSLRAVSSDFAYAYSPEYIHVNIGGDFMRGARITMMRYNTRIGWDYLKLMHAHMVYNQLCKRVDYMVQTPSVSHVNAFVMMHDWFKRNPLQILNPVATEIEIRRYPKCPCYICGMRVYYRKMMMNTLYGELGISRHLFNPDFEGDEMFLPVGLVKQYAYSFMPKKKKYVFHKQNITYGDDSDMGSGRIGLGNRTLYFYRDGTSEFIENAATTQVRNRVVRESSHRYARGRIGQDDPLEIPHVDPSTRKRGRKHAQARARKNKQCNRGQMQRQNQAIPKTRGYKNSRR